ncbi:hypothetical protein [Paenibacillus tarimensis]|nr:hypothetical protein [Paenibacillus tarimensis]MCF2943246.1 hypothetical protein [Paenibacillus tarimensis]
MSARRKPPVIKAKPQETVNRKALIWIGAAAAFVIIGMAVLLVING